MILEKSALKYFQAFWTHLDYNFDNFLFLMGRIILENQEIKI